MNVFVHEAPHGMIFQVLSKYAVRVWSLAGQRTDIGTFFPLNHNSIWNLLDFN